jgi:hypothetical protein
MLKEETPTSYLYSLEDIIFMKKVLKYSCLNTGKFSFIRRFKRGMLFYVSSAITASLPAKPSGSSSEPARNIETCCH